MKVHSKDLVSQNMTEIIAAYIWNKLLRYGMKDFVWIALESYLNESLPE